MRKSFLCSGFLFLLCFLLACGNSPGHKLGAGNAQSGSAVTASPTFACNYEKQKNRARELYGDFRNEPEAENNSRLTRFIADSLLPCWYGTPWDFNGTTQTPQTGTIACGYFVTTVLRDAGMNIDRVKLAQCASEQLVKTTCSGLQRFSNQSLEDFVAAIRKKGFGLFITGLDNHTGFLYNDGSEVYFIHSGVIAPRCALREKAIESVTLRNSKYRVAGKITFR